MKGLTIILVLLFLAIPLYSTDYYVDKTTGSDSDSGLTEELAWETLVKVATFDNNPGFNPGDNIYFKRGEEWVGGDSWGIEIDSSGTNGSPITFGAYGTGDKPVIRGDDWVGIGSAAGADYITIQDLEITSANGSGIYFGTAASTNIIISRCDFSNIPTNAIELILVDTFTIEDCVITTVGNSGIAMNGSASNKITNGLIDGCIISGATTNDGITLHKDGSENATGDNFAIKDCVIFDCAENAIDLDCNGGSNIVITGCTTYGCTTYPGIYTATATYVFIDDCYDYNNKFGIYPDETTIITITNTRVYNTTERSIIDATGESAACAIRVGNCTFVATDALARSLFRIYTNTDPCIVRNTIFYSAEQGQALLEWPSGTPGSTNADIDYNQYYRTDNDDTQTLWYAKNWADWKSEESQDANSAFGDPTIGEAPNFSLTYGSPCTNAGTWLTTITTANGSGTEFAVDDAKWFHDGFGVTTGSVIQLEGDASTVTVTDVNYGTETITVDGSVSWTQGDGVAFPYYSTGPDIGKDQIPPPAGTTGGVRIKTGGEIRQKTGTKVKIKEPQ